MKSPLDWIRSRRITMGLVAALLAGVISASCGSSPSAAPPATTQPPAQVTKGTTGTTSTTTTTTNPGPLPSCGSQRDPLDPTEAPPPAGSPANC
jgi:nitrous oxide reductase accessory protein NosL